MAQDVKQARYEQERKAAGKLTQADWSTGADCMVKLSRFEPAVPAVIWGNQDSALANSVRVQLRSGEITSVHLDHISAFDYPDF